MDGLEVLDVLVVEEHVADGDDLLVDLVRVTGKDDTLCNNAGRRRREQSASSDELESWLLHGIGEVRYLVVGS